MNIIYIYATIYIYIYMNTIYIYICIYEYFFGKFGQSEYEWTLVEYTGIRFVL